jgi:hypothetical protein
MFFLGLYHKQANDDEICATQRVIEWSEKDVIDREDCHAETF